MEELKRLLGQTDDEYLIGLSNKGIVKRSYKDLEQESPDIQWSEEGARVALREVVCQIRVPLGESTCSCPSRSICRHVITAILALRRQAAAEGKTGNPDPERGGKEEGQEAAKEKNGREADSFEEALEEELLALPLQKLKKACGIRRFRQFVERMRLGEHADILEGVVITVRLPWEGTTVKLLSPFAYSTCTCHSKELCVHKAQAALAFQLEKGAVTLEILQKLLEGGEEWNPAELKATAAAIKEGIRLQLMTGLSRLSPEAAGSMERLAVISHGAGLAAFETRFREAASWYRMYFERKAQFRTEVLEEKLLDLYRRASLLLEAGTVEEVKALAGSFRDLYVPVPRLHLVAIGERAFHSKTGYDGETYYFLEIDQGRFYTWTDARPVFYEGIRRPKAGRMDQAAAPWGLNCSREQMLELEFYLDHAKAAEGGRLSSSQETKAEIVGIRDLSQEAVQKRVLWDYRALLELAGTDGLEPKGDLLALVGAVHCKEGVFDPVQQRFSMELTDRGGRKIQVAVRYTEEEKLLIRVLERLGRRIREQGEKPLVFLGIPYVERGELNLYPIEYFEEEGICSGRMELEQREAREEEKPGPKTELVRSMELFLEEVRASLTDLFQSGLHSVREETLRDLKRLSRESEYLGLSGAGEELGILEGELSKKRHQMDFDPEPALESLIRLSRYLELCLRRTAYDRALGKMEEGRC